MRLRYSTSFILLISVYVFACSRDEAPTAPGEPVEIDRSAIASTAMQPTMDEFYLALSEDIAGFGGMYFDDSGSLQVIMTDTVLASAAQADLENLRTTLSTAFAHRTVSPAQVKFRPGKYSFRQLLSWKRLLIAELGGIEEIVWFDADESANRVDVGVSSQGSPASVKAEAIRAGVPEDAIRIEEAGDPAFLSTVQSKIRPVIGGIQYARLGSTGAGFCSLAATGQSVRFSGESVLLTASHCTSTFGGSDPSDQFHQPKVDSMFSEPTQANMIAVELYDPPYFTNSVHPDCPPGKQCRMSDSALLRLTGSTTVDLFRVARPDCLNSNSCSLLEPPFQIVEAFHWTAEGETVEKIGATTGHTQGVVDDTCMTFKPAFSPWAVLCVNRVDPTTVSAGSGDSGGAVFTTVSGTDINFRGIVVAGATSPELKWFFSPWGTIYNDMGGLGF